MVSEEIKQGDRIVLIQELKQGKRTFPVGMVGTCRQYLDDTKSLMIVQYDCIDEQPQYVGVPPTFTRLATSTDLDTVDDYKRLIPKVYHNGNKYSIDNEVWTISGIKLAGNELKDVFTIKNNKGDMILHIDRDRLDTVGAYIPVEILNEPEPTVSTEVVHQTNEDSSPIENDDIILTINGIEFKIVNDKLVIPAIDLAKVDSLILSLNKVKRLLGKDENNG